MRVYLNGKIVPLKDARVSVLDHGFLYGDGIYETMRVYGGVIFMVQEHMERLNRSASLIGLDLRKTPAEILSAMYETLEANKLRDAYLRLTVSRGEGPIGLDPALCPRPTFFILAEKLVPYPGQFYENGLKVHLARTRRNFKGALDPRIKSLNFLNNVLAKIEAKQAGANEAVMLTYENYLAEGTVSNIFFVNNGALRTPAADCGILDGITRRVVLEIARRLDVKTEEGSYRAQELAQAEEAFITSTTMEVMPVGLISGIEGEEEKSLSVGPATKLLMAEFKKEVAAYVEEARAAGPSLWGY